MSKSVFMTGVAIANSMVGSSMILFPLKFNQYGIGINVIFVIFMAAIMSLTCKLLVDHLLPHELDIAVSIRRKLGPAFSTAFGLMSSATLFLVSSVFFLLAVDIFYDVFLQLFGDVALNEKIFKLILMCVFALLNFLKDLKYVFMLAPVAMGALIISTITLIASIPFNADNITASFLDWKPLELKDLLAVASLNGFAFICHPSISPMIKENGNQKKNHIAVYTGFGLTTVLYMLVGVLGALSIYGKDKGKGHEDIIDYFTGSFQSPLIGSLTFLYLFLISPIFPYVSKNQALQLLPKKKREGISNLWLKSSAIYGICWIPMNIVFILFDTSPVIVIGFISTVMAFYITYFLPIYMTIKVGNYKDSHPNEQDGEDNIDSLIVPTEDDGRLKQGESLLTEGELQVIERQPVQLWQKGLYLCILAYGVFILICELISLFA